MRAPVLAFAALVPAACQDSEEPADAPQVERSDVDEALTTVEIRAIDFATLELGPRIEGPEGPQVTANLATEAGVLGELTSYVACPPGMATCDPASAPPNTIYTYVHVVRPRADLDGNESAPFAELAAFYMNNPAHGFMGHAGYAMAEAEEAGGAGIEIGVTCDHRGALGWTIDPGGRERDWKGGEPITFFWQSTLPPMGPAPSYVLRASGLVGAGDGPYPAADTAAINMCERIDDLPAPGSPGPGAGENGSATIARH